MTDGDLEREEQALARLRSADPGRAATPSIPALEARVRRRIGEFGESGDAGLSADVLRDLDAESTDHAEPDTTASDQPPLSLDAARERRRVPGTWLAAAAAVAIAAAGGGFVLGGGDLPLPTAGTEEADQPEAPAAGDAQVLRESRPPVATEDAGGGESGDQAAADDAAPESGAEMAAPGDESLESASALTMSADRSVTAPPRFVWAGSEPLAQVAEESITSTPADEVVRLTPTITSEEEFEMLADDLGLEVDAGNAPDWFAASDSDGAMLNLGPDGALTYTGNALSSSSPGQAPSEDAALDAAEVFVGGLGADTGSLTWEVVDSSEWGTVALGRQDTSAPIPGEADWQVTVGESGEVADAQGLLVTEEPIGALPIVSAEQALERLDDPEFVGAGPSALMQVSGVFAANSAEEAESSGTVPWVRPTVELSEVSLASGTFRSADGQTYLVPVYEFVGADGVPVPVIALEDDALGLE